MPRPPVARPTDRHAAPRRLSLMVAVAAAGACNEPGPAYPFSCGELDMCHAHVLVGQNGLFEEACGRAAPGGGDGRGSFDEDAGMIAQSRKGAKRPCRARGRVAAGGGGRTSGEELRGGASGRGASGWRVLDDLGDRPGRARARGGGAGRRAGRSTGACQGSTRAGGALHGGDPRVKAGRWSGPRGSRVLPGGPRGRRRPRQGPSCRAEVSRSIAP